MSPSKRCDEILRIIDSALAVDADSAARGRKTLVGRHDPQPAAGTPREPSGSAGRG